MTKITTAIRYIIRDRIPLTSGNHDELLGQDRLLYAALLRIPGLADSDAMEIINRLLAVTTENGAPVNLETKKREDRLIAEKLPEIKPAAVISGFKVLVKNKVNNQRTSGWIKAYILGSPNLEDRAVSFRKSFAELLRHAMGKHTAQNCVHFLKRPELTTHEWTYLQKNLFKFKGENDEELVKFAFLFLFKVLEVGECPERHQLIFNYLEARHNIRQGQGLPYKVLRGIAETYHKGTKTRTLRNLARKEKERREVAFDEDYIQENTLAGYIKRHYITGESEQIEQKTIAEAALLPHWESKVALILDLSDSMKGSGVRAYNNVSIALAIGEVFARKTRQLSTITVGNPENGRFPVPNGATNLAKAILNAFELEPDLILVVTDGYENMEQGDCKAILEAAQEIGYNTPLLHILPAFTTREIYAHRRPFGENSVIVETGERGFLPLWLNIQFELNPDAMEDTLRNSLHSILN